MAASSSPRAYLNGRFLPAAEAAVAVHDAGFVLGVTVTEQLRTFAGRLFRLDEHLARLRRSLEIVGIGSVSTTDLADAAEELVAHNHALLDASDDLGLAVFITPGPYATLAPADMAGPTVGLHTFPLPFHLWAERYAEGQPLATTRVRQVPAACWPPELKCRSRVHYYLADREAARLHPGAKAVLLDEQGNITETATANVLICREGKLLAPPLEEVLPGVSLATVKQTAKQLNIPLSHQPLTPEDVASAQEVLLTSTPWCLLPVCTFNGDSIADGKPGEVYGRLLDGWNELAGVDLVEQARRFATR